MRYLVNISYDGTEFYGFQKQPNKRTISNEIEEALTKILNQKTTITGCSRTDKGVHACDYYFHFDTEKQIETHKLQKSLNSILTDEIYIKNIKQIEENFHARYNVKSKTYKYIINTGEKKPTNRNYILEYNKKINKTLLKKASKHLKGTHNFKSFTSDNEKENYIRTINYIKIKEKNELIIIYINANGFLKYMVRNIIGLFLEINEGKKQIKNIQKILESKNRTHLGIKAPSNGLYLEKVYY